MKLYTRRKPGVSRSATVRAAALLVTLALLAGACGISPREARLDRDRDYRSETVIIYRDSRSGDSTDTRSDEATDSPTDEADENMQSGQQLPEDFPVPVPEDYEVQAVGQAGGDTSAVLGVPSGEDAYNYYRQALMEAGFEVVDEGRNQSGYFDAELEFSSRDYEGNFDFDGNIVEIDVVNYE